MSATAEVRSIGVDVRIIVAPKELKTIGALKRFGFMQASSEWVAELDHDDLLTPDCVAELRKAFDAGAEFVYSNMAAFSGDDWDADTFWPANTPTRPCSIYGRDLLEGIAEFTPHTILAASHNGPCHVRAWTKELYKRIGGHDEAIHLTEDLELLARTYLARPRVTHITKALYAFRFDPASDKDQGDTFTKEIPNWTVKHARKLVNEWCERNDYPQTVVRHGVAWDGAPVGHAIVELDQADLIPRAWAILRHGGFLSMRVKNLGTTIRHWSPTDRSETARFQLAYALPREDSLTDILLIADKGEGRLAGVNHWDPRINEAEVLRWVAVLKTYGATWQVQDGRCLLYGEEARKLEAFMERLRPGCFVAVEGARV